MEIKVNYFLKWLIFNEIIQSNDKIEFLIKKIQWKMFV